MLRPRFFFLFFSFGRAIRASAEFFRGLMKTKNGVTVTFDFWIHILGLQARQKLLRKADCYFYIFFNISTVSKTVSKSVLCNYDQNKPFDTSSVSVYAANCRGSCSSFIHRVGMHSHWTFVSSLAANHIFFFLINNKYTICFKWFLNLFLKTLRVAVINRLVANC